MTTKEFEDKRRELIKALYGLENNYAIQNAKYSIGDIIQSKLNTIKIESLNACRRNKESYLPIVLYKGKLLTKKLEFRKDGETSTIPEDKVLKKLN